MSASTTKQREEFDVDVALNGVNPKLRFLIRKLSGYKPSVICWLTIPDFEREALLMLSKGMDLNNKTLLPVMQRIFTERMEEAKSGGRDFHYHRLARNCMKQIEKAIQSSEVENDSANG